MPLPHYMISGPKTALFPARKGSLPRRETLEFMAGKAGGEGRDRGAENHPLPHFRYCHASGRISNHLGIVLERKGALDFGREEFLME